MQPKQIGTITVLYRSPLNQVLIAIEHAYVDIINIIIDLYYRLVYAILKFIIENELTKRMLALYLMQD